MPSPSPRYCAAAAAAASGLRVTHAAPRTIADDYSEIAVRRLLTLDCEVVGSVTDAALTAEAAQRLQPDVIVLDLHLPNVRALEACRQITRVNPAIKVIMFTGLDDPHVSQASLAAGASAFVSKLASFDLLPAIKRVCADRE
jgi:DNA-binding NarL/FixJ family response regulator